MSKILEPLEELDVMNNYMINKLTTDPKTAEPTARLMIKALLGINLKNITVHAESIIVPDLPKLRGVRLDVEINEIDESGLILQKFDLEPHRKPKIIEQYPLINRYRQAQLDKNSLPHGSNDFNSIPNLYILTITNYDIFGLDRMVYTFKNTCIEAPELCYNDKVRLVYFNTSGSVCDDASLRNFLKYIEDSKDSNAVDDNTKEIHEYVSYIRNSYGGDYVTVGDWIDSIVDEKYDDLKAEIERNKADLATKVDEIAAKDDEIAAKDDEIAAKDDEIAAKDDEIAAKDDEIAAMNDEIARLRAELDKLKD